MKEPVKLTFTIFKTVATTSNFLQLYYCNNYTFVFVQGKTNHLQDTSVYLPMVKNADSLKFFHDIEKLRFSSEYFTLTAMDLGDFLL